MEITARLTGDAKVNTLKDERKVVHFSVAVNDTYKPKGSVEFKKQATFIQCSYWINPAIAPYLTKGSLVELYGRIGVNAYADAEGNAKAAITFHVIAIKLHGGAKSTLQTKESVAIAGAGKLTEPLEDLPF
jgi:single-strand DNA-binding protein